MYLWGEDSQRKVQPVEKTLTNNPLPLWLRIYWGSDQQHPPEQQQQQQQQKRKQRQRQRQKQQQQQKRKQRQRQRQQQQQQQQLLLLLLTRPRGLRSRSSAHLADGLHWGELLEGS